VTVNTYSFYTFLQIMDSVKCQAIEAKNIFIEILLMTQKTG